MHKAKIDRWMTRARQSRVTFASLDLYAHNMPCLQASQQSTNQMVGWLLGWPLGLSRLYYID